MLSVRTWRQLLYNRLRQGRFGSRTIYSFAGYIFWLTSERKFYFGTRVVEIPWVFKQLRKQTVGSGALLQVGNVLLKEALQKYEVELVDIDAEEDTDHRLKVHKADIRTVILPESHFDIAISISTLEHIGIQGPSFSDGDRLAVSAIAKALKPEGRFIFTVPFGNPVIRGNMRIYDSERIATILEHLFEVEEALFLTWNKYKWQENSRQNAERAGFLKDNSSMNCGIALVAAKKINSNR